MKRSRSGRATKPGLVDQLSTELYLNPGPNEIVVYDGPYVLPDLSGGAEPLPFELRIPCTTLFHYQGDDLLVDMKFTPTPAAQLNLDAVWTLGDGVSVGHKAMVHGCTVGENSLIGINAQRIDCHTTTLLCHID